MQSLNPPTLNVQTTLNACISSIQDEGLKASLTAISLDLIAAETSYITCGQAMSLFSIPQTPDVSAVVSGDTMRRVYSGTFVKSVPTRPMYDAIKFAPANDICPLCSQRTVSTLDHYLSQSRHAALTIIPANLVPACAECNKVKLNHQPANETDQSFHPYFDDCNDARWLMADVIEEHPAALFFRVQSPANWSATKFARTARHFNAFKLASLYASHAAVEITNIRYALGRIDERGGAMDIQVFLSEQAESARLVHQNSWRAATYEALAQSNWFCDGGYAAD
ncbi:hypothetical protein [Parasphingorhabdus sp.]|jgi:hypothetical protein|uniref:hypothetical protein n=1 Tax=Parasphingorhabdus sp. TaxID=2709688 RepID=UPI003D26C17E